MRLSLLLLPLLLCPGFRAFAAGDFRLPYRAGLFGDPGFTEGGDQLLTMTPAGWLSGYSTVEGKRTPWVANPSDGVSRRVGFLPGLGVEVENVSTGIDRMMNSGVACGYSGYLADPVSQIVIRVPWVADGATGRTLRGGLTGPEYTPANGPPLSAVGHLTASGYAAGSSVRFLDSQARGLAMWVMDLRAGAVFRAGLHEGPGFTESDGTQQSEGFKLTESGWLGGSSVRAGGLGQAAWVTAAATGVTRRVGLPAGDGDPGSDGVMGINENGCVTGIHSARNPGGVTVDLASWAADAATGVTRRIGLFEGDTYTNPLNGAHRATAHFLTESGWILGRSDLYGEGEYGIGTAAWVAEAGTGITRRVGLYEGDEFIRAGRAVSGPALVTESGWVWGTSSRYHADPRAESPSAGEVAWVARASTGVTRRLGFTGGNFRGQNGEEHSYVLAMTESGWLSGVSTDYQTPGGEYGVYWVAEAATGVTRRVGLTGPEFESSAGARREVLEGLTEDGRVYGYSLRYRGAALAGYAAWVGDAATGSARRVGLTGGEFTRAADGWEESSVKGWTQSGFLHGVSLIHSADGSTLTVPWVADTATGETRPLGSGAPGAELTLADSVILSEAGLVAGSRLRAGNTGVTSWVMDIKTARQVDFDLSVSAPAGHRSSRVEGITPGGVVFGTYGLFRNNVYVGPRPFLWEAGLGTLVADDAAPGEENAAVYEYLATVTVNAQGFATGAAKPAGVQGSAIFHGKALSLANPDPGLRVTDLTKTAEGQHRLSFSADRAIRVTLQSSPDLVVWTDMKTTDAPAGASHMDIEADPSAPSKQCWRLKTVPKAP